MEIPLINQVLPGLITFERKGLSLSVSALLICATLFAGCMTLPPSASFDPPSNRRGPVEGNAWLKKVDITDPAMDEQERKGRLEQTLTNNLLRFLRDGKYFRKVELLPGTTRPEDYVLHFQFDRYRQERYSKVFQSYDASDLSATLTVTHPDGQLIKEVKSTIKEEHAVAPFSEQAALPSGMRARTQLVEELLQKALFAPNPGP